MYNEKCLKTLAFLSSLPFISKFTQSDKTEIILEDGGLSNCYRKYIQLVFFLNLTLSAQIQLAFLLIFKICN